VETSSPVSAPITESAVPHFFSLSDRVGRLRYFTYIIGAMVGCGFVLVAIYLLAMLLPASLGKLVSVTSYILVKSVVIPLIVFVMSIRRLHDFNASGWWSLTVLIPFVTLALLFVPGNKEANRFGPPPAPNPAGLRLAAIVLPAAVLSLYFFVVSINPDPKSPPPPAESGTKPQLRSYKPG
jgi:uncharacterized membrane protein YhaH (DUF805 family)